MSDPAPARPSARGSKGSAIEIAIVLLIGAALGAAFETTKPSAGSAAIPDSAPAQKAEPSSVYDLPPIVTTLGAPQDVWIRLEGSIVIDPKALPHPESVAGELGEDILAFLRTVPLKQLEGPIGLENLRQDLNERAATRTGGKAREFVIRTLVVQ
jgi:flagellar FliL protein